MPEQQYSRSMEQRSSGSTPWWVEPDYDTPTPDERWLLERVEAQFATEAADLSEWADPHADPSNPGHRLDPAEDEYSRCLEPEKYNIVLSRATAWTTVLTELGWASAKTTSGEFDAPEHQISWALPPWSSHTQGHMTVLRPEAEGAVPQTFWCVDADEDTAASVAIGAGDPAVFLEQMPDCGCDACDSGSEDMFRAIDETVLAVVGGSLVVNLDEKWLSIQTGTGASAGDRKTGPRQTTSFHARPWNRSWTPRPVRKRIDPPRDLPVDSIPETTGTAAFAYGSLGDLEKTQRDGTPDD